MCIRDSLNRVVHILDSVDIAHQEVIDVGGIHGTHEANHFLGRVDLLAAGIQLQCRQAAGHEAGLIGAEVNTHNIVAIDLAIQDVYKRQL